MMQQAEGLSVRPVKVGAWHPSPAHIQAMFDTVKLQMAKRSSARMLRWQVPIVALSGLVLRLVPTVTVASGCEFDAV